MKTIPKISIIIPVYKVEDYLNQCIDSVLCQSMTEIEIILIDDGSPDRCGEICDMYANGDPRVRVIHQNNQGLSAARNAGIDIAQGEYIMFVDSDDWVSPDYCEIPYRIAQENKADLVIFRFQVIGEKNSNSLRNKKPGTISRNDAMKFVYHGGGLWVWNKLYHRDLMRDVRFVPGKYYEDQLFTVDVVHNAEHVYYTDHVLYNYRKREGSITERGTEKIRLDQLEMKKRSAMRLDELGYTEQSKQLYQEYCWNYRTWIGMTGEDADQCNLELLTMDASPKWLGWRGKMMLRMLRISPQLFDSACVLFGKRVKRGS